MEQRAENKGYLLEDYRLFRLNDAQGTKSDYHYHSFCKLLLLRSGSGSYWVDGRRYVLEAGDIVLIPSGCVHRPAFEKGMPYERTIIYIAPDFLTRHSTPTCDLHSIFSGVFGNVLRPESRNRERLFTLADGLEKELAGKAYGSEILQNAALLQLLVQTGRILRDSDINTLAAAELPGGRVGDIRQYIDAHLAEDLTIDMLAQAFYVSKYHMMRQFQKQTGVSIHAYILDRRLFLARERIRQGMRATDSCFRSGFRSYSSFVRAYAKRFGTTPTGRAEKGVLREETFE